MFATQKFTNIPNRHVAMVIYPGCVMQEAVGPLEVFNFANQAFELSGDLAEGEKAYHLSFIADKRGPVTTSNGLKLYADFGYDEVDFPIDTLIIAGATGLPNITKAKRLCGFLTSIQTQVRRLASIGTGIFILAESNLLNGLRATTHWRYGNYMADFYREVRIEPDKIFIKDGNVYTSGGVTASMDLALSLVEEDWGGTVASGVAKEMLVFMRRSGGQSQSSTLVMNEAKTRRDFRELQAWIVSNPHTNLSVESLAEKMTMSPRNFSRIFFREAGITPAKFVERIRLETARNLMAQTDQPVEMVANKSGFNNAEQMWRSFHRLLKISPLDYREKFRSRYQIKNLLSVSHRPQEYASVQCIND